MSNGYVVLCQRCKGRGRYDRGNCFKCTPFGAMGWVRRATRSEHYAQVTAIRNPTEGRIDWIKIYDATPKQAIDIVQRQMRVRELPASVIDSVKATAV